MITRIKTLMATLAAALVLFAGGPARADTSREELAVVEHFAGQRPDDPDTRFDLAMAYARTPLLEKAWTELQRVRELDPGYADRLIGQLEPIAEDNPQNVEAHWRLAFAHYFKGREANDPAAIARSRIAFEHILTIDPTYVWAYNYLAYITYEGGDLPAALALARKAVEVGPDNAVAHFLVGQALFKQDQPFAAALSLARAMQLRSVSGYGLPVPARIPPSQEAAQQPVLPR